MGPKRKCIHLFVAFLISSTCFLVSGKPHSNMHKPHTHKHAKSTVKRELPSENDDQGTSNINAALPNDEPSPPTSKELQFSPNMPMEPNNQGLEQNPLVPNFGTQPEDGQSLEPNFASAATNDAKDFDSSTGISNGFMPQEDAQMNPMQSNPEEMPPVDGNMGSRFSSQGGNGDAPAMQPDGNGVYPAPGEGDRRSSVPIQFRRLYLPVNESHPEGEHKHVTDDAILTHKNNESNWSGVSRYPPFIAGDGSQGKYEDLKTENNSPSTPQGSGNGQPPSIGSSAPQVNPLISTIQQLFGIPPRLLGGGQPIGGNYGQASGPQVQGKQSSGASTATAGTTTGSQSKPAYPVGQTSGAIDVQPKPANSGIQSSAASTASGAPAKPGYPVAQSSGAIDVQSKPVNPAVAPSLTSSTPNGEPKPISLAGLGYGQANTGTSQGSQEKQAAGASQMKFGENGAGTLIQSKPVPQSLNQERPADAIQNKPAVVDSSSSAGNIANQKPAGNLREPTVIVPQSGRDQGAPSANASSPAAPIASPNGQNAAKPVPPVYVDQGIVGQGQTSQAGGQGAPGSGNVPPIYISPPSNVPGQQGPVPNIAIPNKVVYPLKGPTTKAQPLTLGQPSNLHAETPQTAAGEVVRLAVEPTKYPVNQPVATDNPICSRYPFEMCADQWMQANCQQKCKGFGSNNTTVPTSSATPTKQQTPAPVDNELCTRYPVEFCYDKWMATNCPAKCMGKTNVTETARPLPPVPSCSYKGGTYDAGSMWDDGDCTSCSCNNNGNVNCENLCNKTELFSGNCTAPTSGGNSNKTCCNFPFIYGGVPYHTCILNPGQGYWCGVTANFDNDRQWGNCGCVAPPCPTIGPPQTTAQPATTSQTTPSSATTQPRATTTTAPQTTTPAPQTTTPPPQTTTPAPTTTPTTPATTPQTTTPSPTTNPQTTPASTTTPQTTLPPTTTQATTASTQGTTPTQATTRTTQPASTIPPDECSTWSAWTECDHTCDGGEQHRYRNCRKNGQNEIEGDVQTCNTRPCPPECLPWQNWTACSRTCGYGYKQRVRYCKAGNTFLPFGESAQCYEADCPAVCKEWSEWGACSLSCGIGVQERKRNCTLTNGIETDTQEYYESRHCNVDPCPPVCQEWSSWTDCSKSCGEGTQQRERNCKLSTGEVKAYWEHRVCNTDPCPPVCEDWSKWGDCSASCGGGIQERVRNCTVEDKGKNTTTTEIQSNFCNEQECPPEANCTEWGVWTECTKTCDGGERSRAQLCKFSNNSAFMKVEEESCNSQPCVPICGDWSAFTECSVSCGGGFTERWRTCDGDIEADNVTCNTMACPMTTSAPPTTTPTVIPDCTNWSNWSDCSATCNGMQTRLRHCRNDTHESDELQARPCNTNPCPDCSEWSEWSACDVSCGDGKQYRNRTCADSNMISSEYRPCHTDCPVECHEWSRWSECTRTCGGGYQERYRSCDKGETQTESNLCNAQPCPTPTQPPPTTATTPSITTTAEPTSKPPTPPKHECLIAYLSFDRVDDEKKIVYDEGPYHNDAQLAGSVEFVEGNFSCGKAAQLYDGEIVFDGEQFTPKPIHGVTIAAWVFLDSITYRQSLFSTRSGGGSTDNYFLEVEQGKIFWTHKDQNGTVIYRLATEATIPALTWVHLAGSYNATLGEVRIFVNANEIKIQPGNGTLTTDWGDYAGIAAPVYDRRFHGLVDEFYVFNCSLTVDIIREIADTCKVREGDECPSPLLGVCPPCPNCTESSTTPTPTIDTTPGPTTTPSNRIDGGYENWSQWSSCSKTCGMGLKSRHRECNSPTPSNGGKTCEDQGMGAPKETAVCNAGPCPADGNWSEWTSWSECSASCGVGVKTHYRQCDNPRPQWGGKHCQGNDMEEMECSIIPCPVNGNYTSWTMWSECSKSCGEGSRSRTRNCANPTPKFNGRDCAPYGPGSQSEKCNITPCPVNGHWSQWSNWTSCSKSCGEGRKLRERSCTNPPPSNGGIDCEGEAKESLYCRLTDCCSILYQDIGCYKDKGSMPRPLPELLFTDRDPQHDLYTGRPLHGQDFMAYALDLICRCATAAKGKKYSHFGIQEFGECYSGPEVAQTYDIQGQEERFSFRPSGKPWVGCMDLDFKKCEQPSETCVGQEFTNFVYGLENITSIDGNYTEWSRWSQCSQSCGNGIHSRSRECTNPKPAFGGTNCSSIGPDTQTGQCNLGVCPVDGHWGHWGNWSGCSSSCGPGQRTRSRKCDNPAPVGDGLVCPGNDTSVEHCEISPCPVDCGWSEWTDWGVCSVSCGEGVHSRSRTPNNPSAAYGGQECQGDSGETKPCLADKECPVDGNYTSWESWSSCSKTCGGGFRERVRNCTNPAPKFGADCSRIGPARQTEECNVEPCKKDGNYSEWSEWSACDASCGVGSRKRTRKCDSPMPANGGKNCTSIGVPTAYENCDLPSCPIDGAWSNWETWSDCSKTCSQGITMRTRKCDSPSPKFGGSFCPGEDSESKICNKGPCCTIPYRDIGCYADKGAPRPLPEKLFDDKENIDLDFFDDYIEDVICRCAQYALENKYTHFSIQSLSQCWSGLNAGSTYSKDGKSDTCVTKGGSPNNEIYEKCVQPNLYCVGVEQTNFVYGLANVTAMDGNYTTWSNWSACSATCGSATRSRSRTCTNPPPAFGGKDCTALGADTETENCQIPICQNEGPEPVWSPWQPWSATCGNAFRSRELLCNASQTSPKCGDIEEETADFEPCPVDGNYTQWSEWSSCSVSCGNGTQQKLRTCTKPRPQFGGKTCLEQSFGPAVQERPCNDGGCAVDGNWCDWLAISKCSTTCGPGVKTRNRTCECPAPANGGKTCNGQPQETIACNLTGCPVNGGYTQWADWTECDRTCGSGGKTRSRTCTNPSPLNGGLTCLEQNLGDQQEQASCLLQNCPIDGKFTVWSSWSACSKTCGEGVQHRNRSCTNPKPLHGGKNCTGETEQQNFCKVKECCDIPYKRLGCYADKQLPKRPLPEMLFNEDQKRLLEPWDDFLSDLVCQCARAAKQKKYSHFGIQNLSQCWSGPQVDDTYNKDGDSTECFNNKLPGGQQQSTLTYEKCTEANTMCAGGTGANFIYGLSNITIIDGNYTEWSEWTKCSVTCGKGERTRQRNCTNPSPSFGGMDCSAIGDPVETGECNPQKCPVNGNWGTWTDWTSCSTTCGNGKMSRSRKCDNPPASDGGIPCSETNDTQSQEQACNLKNCPVDGICESWSSWTPCSASCGEGEQKRTRNCTEPQYEGAPCTCSREENQQCSITPCPVNGNWGEWAPWSSCSATCDQGTMNRTRLCDAPAPKHGGAHCNGSSSDSLECNDDPCPIDGKYTEWSEWSACDKSCGSGSQIRTRQCSNPTPSNGGATCVAQGLGAATENKTCNENSCPVNGNWADWTQWSACSVTCGSGKLTRARTCTNPAPAFDGLDCIGPNNDTDICTLPDCCQIKYKRLGCYKDNQIPPRPLPDVLFDESENGKMSYREWNFFLSNVICNCAKMAKEKTLTHFSLQNYGTCYSGGNAGSTYDKDGPSDQCISKTPDPLPTENQFEKCEGNDLNCVGIVQTNFVYGLENVTAIDGNYSMWSEWGPCSVPCGIGVKRRKRLCDNPLPAFGGKDCSSLGPNEEVQDCETIPCPIDGNWSPWGSFSTCSATCGNGTMNRKRTCDDPARRFGGKPCSGNATETVICSKKECAINGGWSEWTTWSSCSVQCGQGVQERSRKCNNPKPNQFGTQCEGPDKDEQNCQKEPCMTCNKVLDLGFLLDTSGSLKGGSADARKFIMDLAGKFEISQKATRVSYMGFARDVPNDYVKFVDSNSMKEFDELVLIEERGGSTYINKAVKKVIDGMFAESSGNRSEINDALVVFTDGIQSNVFPGDETLEEAAKRLRDTGATVIVVGVGANQDKANLKLLASSEYLVFHANNYKEIHGLLRNVSTTLCQGIPEDWGEWSQWSGCSVTCGNGTRTRERTCKSGNASKCIGNSVMEEPCYLAPCKGGQGCSKNFDIGFLLDVSASIETQFDQAKKFIIGIAKNFNVSLDHTRVSYLGFSSYTDPAFNAKFNAIEAIGYLESVILLQQNKGGDTYIHKALTKVLDQMFNVTNGNRPDVPDILVMMSDGKQSSTAPQESPTLDEEITRLSKSGITTIVVGVGSSIDEALLKRIASKPNLLFKADSYNDASTKLTQTITEAICAAETSTWSEWSTWGECSVTCGGGFQSRHRTCSGGVGKCSGSNTETQVCATAPCSVSPTGKPTMCAEKIDLAFIVDESSSIKPEWPNVIQFIKSLISGFDIGDNGTLIAMELYADTPRMQLKFDSIKDKQMLLLTMDTISIAGGSTRIDKALQFAADYVFTHDHGDRSNVLDIAVVITDGKCDVECQPLASAVYPLHKMGVEVLAVGLGPEPEKSELEAIATNKEGGVFSITDYSMLNEYVGRLGDSICKAAAKGEENEGGGGGGDGGGKGTESTNKYMCEPTIFYSFDKSCNQTLFDESGRGNNAVMMGMFSIDDTNGKCKSNFQLQEDGAIELNGPQFSGKPITAVTLATWIYLYPTSKPHSIFAASDAGFTSHYSFEVGPEGAVHFSQILNGAVVFSTTTSPHLVAFSSWIHIAVTYDVVTDKVMVFIDGKPIRDEDYATRETRETELFLMDWTGYVAIGKHRPESMAKLLFGSLDEFYMFPCALTATEISGLKDTCETHVARQGPYAGATYSIIDKITPFDAAMTRTKLKFTQPVYTAKVKDFEAPAWSTFEDKVTSGASNSFFVKLQGYFVPPYTGMYSLTVNGHNSIALYFSMEAREMESGVTKQAHYDAVDDKINSATVNAELTGGLFYHFEAVQVSKGTLNNLSISYNMKCSDTLSVIKTTVIPVNHIQHRIPQNCSEIKYALYGAPDDDYMIRLVDTCGAQRIYCHNMAGSDLHTSMMEFITLESGGVNNYGYYHRSRLINFDSCSGNETAQPNQTNAFWGQTWFKRIRIFPFNLLIDNDEKSFSVTKGHFVEYGRAGDCYSKSKEDCRQGKFRIDFNGTDVHLDQIPTWKSTGSPKDMPERITQFHQSLDSKYVSAKCGGSCSECMPSEKLRIMPDRCDIHQTIIEKRSVSEESPKMIDHLQPKEAPSRWWWFY